MNSILQQQFLQAVKNNDTKTATSFLRKHLSEIDINAYDEDGKSALFYVIQHSNLELLKRLLRRKVDVNQHIEDEQKIKRHPIFYVLRTKHPQSELIYKILIQEAHPLLKQDLEQINDYVLAAAIAKNFHALCDFIDKYSSQEICFYFNLFAAFIVDGVINHDAAAVVLKILAHTKKIENLTRICSNIIFSRQFASQNSNEAQQINDYLLKEILNKAKQLKAITATLAYALDYEYKKVPGLFKALLEEGLDPNSKYEDEKRPVVFRALQRRNFPVIELLIQYPTVLNVEDEMKNTLLHYVASNFDEKMVELILFQPGVNLFAKNQDGVTPLMILAVRGFYDLLKRKSGNNALLAEAIYQYVEKNLNIHFLNQSSQNRLSRYYVLPHSAIQSKKYYLRSRFRYAALHGKQNTSTSIDEYQVIKKAYLERIENLTDPDEATLIQLQQRFVEVFKKIKFNFFHASTRVIQGEKIVNHNTRLRLKYGDPTPAIAVNPKRGGEHLIFGYILPVYGNDTMPRFPTIVLPYGRMVYVFDLEKLLASYNVVVKGNNGNYFNQLKIHIRSEQIADVHLHTEIRGFGQDNSGKGMKYVVAVDSRNKRRVVEIKEKEQVYSNHKGSYQTLIQSLALDVLHRYVLPIQSLSKKAAYQLLFEFSDEFEQQFLQSCSKDNPKLELEKIRMRKAAEIFERADIREATFAATEIPFVDEQTQEKFLVKQYRTLTFQPEDLKKLQAIYPQVELDLGNKFYFAIQENDVETFSAILN